MAESSGTVAPPVVDAVVIKDPIPPATDAEDKKSETPAAADDKTAESAAETTEQQEAKKQSKFQRRLDRQKAARVAAETEARLLRERLADLEGKARPKQEDGEPKREDFQDYEAYLRAVAKYDAGVEADKRLKGEREERQRQERQRDTQAGNERLAQDWLKREKEFQTGTKDYETVVAPFVEEELGSFSEGARRAIVESEVGPQLLYHLASHPDEAERISDLSPLRQVAELGKLEATVAAAPKAKPVSKAPPPIGEVAARGSTAPGYSENMTDEQYREWRKSHGARWAR